VRPSTIPGRARTKEANELDGVAKAMIAANQHALSGERLSIPDGLQVTWPFPAWLLLREPSSEVCVADLPGPFQVAAPHSRGPRAIYRWTALHGRKNRVCAGWFGL
jgi:hypothetical protein